MWDGSQMEGKRLTDREREREGQDKKRKSDEQAFVEKKIWQKKRNRVDGTSRRRAKKRDNEEKGCFVSLISDIHLSFLSLCMCVCPFRLNNHSSPPHAFCPHAVFSVQTCSFPLH